jgi:hypothetical protein
MLSREFKQVGVPFIYFNPYTSAQSAVKHALDSRSPSDFAIPCVIAVTFVPASFGFQPQVSSASGCKKSLRHHSLTPTLPRIARSFHQDSSNPWKFPQTPLDRGWFRLRHMEY